MWLPIFLTLIVFLLSPCDAGIFLLELTTAFYEERETLSGSVVTRMADIKDIAHMDTVYIVAHGWQNASNDTGGIYVFDGAGEVSQG